MQTEIESVEFPNTSKPHENHGFTMLLPVLPIFSMKPGLKPRFVLPVLPIFSMKLPGFPVQTPLFALQGSDGQDVLAQKHAAEGRSHSSGRSFWTIDALDPHEVRTVRTRPQASELQGGGFFLAFFLSEKRNKT